MEKKKILWISDHPLVPSGVGTQSKYCIEGLLETGKYRFMCFGGGMGHPDYRPQKVAPEKYNDDWLIFPVNGYGDKNILRQFLLNERPDAIVIFTDPRFFGWVWEMEDEISKVCPLVYWHVWDNDPTPQYNKVFYDSTDYVAALSLKTYGLLQDIGYEKNRFSYLPHAVPDQLFKPLPEDEIQKYKKEHFGPHADRKFILFWNNRNARRKSTGDVIATFAGLVDRVPRNDVALMMHTAPHDPEGQDILAVAKKFGVDENLIISDQRLPPEEINHFYNATDCTMNISSNEGFGLGTLESLSAGSPIIVHMTGGLQFQIGDWWEDLKDFSDQDKMTAIAKARWKQRTGDWWGVPVFSASRSCTGSQQIPYIYDDRVDHESTINALVQMYKMGRNERRKLGARAREWVLKNFSLEKMISGWDKILTEQTEKFSQGTKLSFREALI